MSWSSDPRWDDTRDRPSPGRGGSETDPREEPSREPRDVFTRGLDLPRGRDREPVELGDETFRLRGSEVRTLATVGAFRVVPVDDLRDDLDRPGDLRHGDLEHLRSEGLLERVASVDRETGTALVTLTERGRELLESYRNRDEDDRAQIFHAGVARPREMVHDAQVYRAYLRAAEHLEREHARIQRIVLEHDLKREYQRFLQEPNRSRADSDGRPGRNEEEIRRWADDHDLRCVDGRVQFPDVQVEFFWPDGRRDVENVEVLTPHYRGAHTSGKVSAGFKTYRFSGGRVGGRTGKGGRFDLGLAEELLR